VSYAVEHHPALQAARHRIAAAEHAVDAQGFWPVPKLQASGAPLPIETKEGPAWAAVRIDQPFPWMGELDAKQAVAVATARGVGRTREVDVLWVSRAVRLAYIGAWETSRSTLQVVLPLALLLILLILLILYLQFRRVSTALFVFSGVAVACAGGFVMPWLYAQAWFLDIDLFGVNLRSVANAGTYNLSVAVWVGFIALFGIATDDGVVMSTYLTQTVEARRPTTVQGVREATVEATLRRVRPCLMTTATRCSRCCRS
jgi:multidrug efflux pump subunit AcrB